MQCFTADESPPKAFQMHRGIRVAEIESNANVNERVLSNFLSNLQEIEKVK